MSFIGEQFVSPDGFGQIVNGRRYYFLGHHGEPCYAILCFFEEETRKVYLETMSSGKFEEAIESKVLKVAENQVTLPPWLDKLEGVDLSQLDKNRAKKIKKKYKNTVKERYAYIKSLIKKEKQIFSSPDPEMKMNEIIRKSNNPGNVTRIRLWFLCYLCFGRTKWCLVPSWVNCGHWEREGKKITKKIGKPSRIKGKNSGHNVDKNMREHIYAGYRKYGKSGVKLTSIYVDSMSNIFTCKVRQVDENKKEIYHPNNEPFPSEDQFRYWVYKEFGKDKVQEKLYGKTRTRNRKRSSKGKFTEYITNLLEKVEADAYYVKEVPKGVRDGEMMPPLSVVKIRDVLSGNSVGVGFAIGAERKDAYLMALFCMAISKTQFCRYFGMEDAAGWDTIGLPTWLTVDRGPGDIRELFEGEEALIPIRELSPSYEGQSKAVVESGHPRYTKLEGKPTFIESNLTYIELMQREIRRCIAENEKSDISSRLTPKMKKEIPIYNPLNLWKYFDKRYRTCAHSISFDTAVRLFLPKIKFTIHEDGLYIYGNWYKSEELMKTGICENVISDGRSKIDVYVISGALRQAWVNINNKLIQINAMAPIRVDGKELFLPLEELRLIAEIDKDVKSELKAHRLAIEMESRENFKSSTGKGWDSGKRRPGTSKRSKRASNSEYLDLKTLMNGK